MNLVLSGSESKLVAYYQFNDSNSSLRGTDDKTGFSTICWTGSTTGYLPAADTSGSTITYALVQQGSLGTAVINATTGKFTYTAGSTKGYDTFKYSATVGGVSATQTITVSVGTLSNMFIHVTGSASPMYGIDVNTDRSFVKLVDLDGDGDLDAYYFSHVGYGGWFENTGTAYSASYVRQTASPVAAQTWCENGTEVLGCMDEVYACVEGGISICEEYYYQHPYRNIAFVDEGSDRDWDMYSVVLGFDNTVRFYENAGSATSPLLSLGSSTHMYGTPTIKNNVSDFFFADIYETGYASAVFMNMSKTTHPLTSLVNVGDGTWGAPTTDILQTNFSNVNGNLAAYMAAIGDVDGDGAWDVLIGGYGNYINLDVYRNTGTSLAPVFGSPTTPFNDQIASFGSAPNLADLDGDGDLDLVLAGWNEDVIGFYRNDTKFYVTQSAPTASSVAVSGAVSGVYQTGIALTLSYTYSDPDGDTESGTTIQWQHADDTSGTNVTSVSSTTSTYTPGAADADKYLRGCVTAADYYLTGTQVCSGWVQVYPTITWFTDSSYGTPSSRLSYVPSDNGKCVNMSTFSMDNTTSSMQLYARNAYVTYAGWYKDNDCSGSKSTTYTNGATYTGVSSFSSTMNDAASSYRVAWVAEQRIPSASGCFAKGTTLLQNELAYLTFQSDGNLVLYKRFPADNKQWAAWSSGTNGSAASNTCFQTDGNLVLYNSSGKALWASGTANKSVATLRIQTDCNLVMYSSSGAQWATGTAGCFD